MSSGTQISSDIVSECGVPEVSPEEPRPVHSVHCPPGGDLGLEAGGGGLVLLHEADLGQPLTKHGVRGQGPSLDSRYVLKIFCLEAFS